MKKELLINITGYYIGDGYELGKSIAISTTNRTLATKYKKLINTLTSKTRIYKRKKRKHNWKPEIIICIRDEKLVKKIKKIRKELARLIREEKYARVFLRGIFDAEGSIDFRSTRRGRRIKITNSSKSIIDLVSQAMKTMNIHHKLVCVNEKRKNRRDYYEVIVYGQESLKFIYKIKPFKLLDKNYFNKSVNTKYRPLIRALLSVEPKP